VLKDRNLIGARSPGRTERSDGYAGMTSIRLHPAYERVRRMQRYTFRNTPDHIVIPREHVLTGEGQDTLRRWYGRMQWKHRCDVVALRQDTDAETGDVTVTFEGRGAWRGQ